jgi:tetratricopeptide (TPR) repeat protein
MKISLFLFPFLIFASQAFAAKQGYAVSQADNMVIVKTPWGSSIFLAPVGFDQLSSYSFEVPLSNFRAGLEGANEPTGHGSGGLGSDSGPETMGDINSLISQANLLYNQGEFTKALQYVDQVSIRDPKNIRGWIMKGSLMHVLGYQDLAKQAWQKALDLDPANSQIRNILQEMK